MRSDELKRVLKESLTGSLSEIIDHLEQSTRRVEEVFAEPLLTAWGKRCVRERPLSEMGSKSFYPARPGGRMDAVLTDEEGRCKTGFEFKAVRMPRLKSNSLYDVGQLSSDFMRLRSARKCRWGWVIAYVYGPLVDDARSDRDLFRRFQNQMFVDVSLIKQEYRLGSEKYEYELIDIRRKAFEMMGWTRPATAASMSTEAFAVLISDQEKTSVGAVCYQAREAPNKE